MRATERRYWRNGYDKRPLYYLPGQRRRWYEPRSWHCLTFTAGQYGVMVTSSPTLAIFKLTEEV